MNHSSQKKFSRPSLFIIVLLGCCAGLIFSSCSKNASTAIIGKWRVQEGQKETVEFRKDGTVINPQNQEQNGKYTFTDGSHMNMQINNGNTNQPEISLNCVVHIQGDKMDMTMTVPGQSQQQKTHFTRLK